jgi:hypothetical protein
MVREVRYVDEADKTYMVVELDTVISVVVKTLQHFDLLAFLNTL